MKKITKSKPVLKKKKCAHCKKSFMPDSPAQKTCSDFCNDKHRKNYVLPLSVRQPQPSLHEDCLRIALEDKGVIEEKNARIDELLERVADLRKSLDHVIRNSNHFDEIQKQNECILDAQIKTLQSMGTITDAVTILLDARKKEIELNESAEIKALPNEHEYYQNKTKQNWLKKLLGIK